MAVATIPNNVTQFPARLCACGCGHAAPYGKYAGIPKSTEYNRHAKAASRNRRKSDVKYGQTVKPDSDDLFALVKQAVREVMAEFRQEPSAPHIVKARDTSGDEVEIEITEAKADTNNRSDWNFMIASALQVYGNYDSLPPEIIEYGERTGRIQEPKPVARVVESKGNAKALAGASVELSAPDFSDVEDLI